MNHIFVDPCLQEIEHLMCNFQSWYFDDNGYVVECKDCNHYQVCFGTTLLTLNEKNYQVFVENLFITKENYCHVNNANLKCVVLPTPASCVSSILTQYELDNLYNMLQEVDTEKKTVQLLQLFNPPLLG
jgi:hypothetical protein